MTSRARKRILFVACQRIYAVLPANVLLYKFFCLNTGTPEYSATQHSMRPEQASAPSLSALVMRWQRPGALPCAVGPL